MLLFPLFFFFPMVFAATDKRKVEDFDAFKYFRHQGYAITNIHVENPLIYMEKEDDASSKNVSDSKKVIEEILEFANSNKINDIKETVSDLMGKIGNNTEKSMPNANFLLGRLNEEKDKAEGLCREFKTLSDKISSDETLSKQLGGKGKKADQIVDQPMQTYKIPEEIVEKIFSNQLKLKNLKKNIVILKKITQMNEMDANVAKRMIDFMQKVEGIDQKMFSEEEKLRNFAKNLMQEKETDETKKKIKGQMNELMENIVNGTKNLANSLQKVTPLLEPMEKGKEIVRLRKKYIEKGINSELETLKTLELKTLKALEFPNKIPQSSTEDMSPEDVSTGMSTENMIEIISTMKEYIEEMRKKLNDIVLLPIIDDIIEQKMESAKKEKLGKSEESIGTVGKEFGTPSIT